MDESREYYAKINKSDVERQILYDFIYIWKLKKKTNEQTKQKKNSQKQNKLMVATEDGVGQLLKK